MKPACSISARTGAPCSSPCSSSSQPPGTRCRGAAATIAQSQVYYLDVTALAANKGDGLVALATAFDQPLGAVAVLGDQYNDVPMLERAGVAIA